MSQLKGEHGTCETVTVKGVVVNKSDLHKGSGKSEHAEKAEKVSHGKETKAEKKARLADEKQAKKDADAAERLEDGEVTE